MRPIPILLLLPLLLQLVPACTERLELSVDPVPNEIGTNILKISGKVSVQPEISKDIGASWDPKEVQLQYVSFAPIIAREEAIDIAKNWMRSGFNINSDNLPIEATVALYSGPVRPPSVRPTGEGIRDVKAWIVVIKDVPGVGPAGLAPAERPYVQFKYESQAHIAIDATTGKIIYGETGAKVLNQ